MPDLPYFVRLAPRGGFGHTLPGLFLLCLPVGIGLLWLLDRRMKRPLVELLPSFLRERLAGALPRSPFDEPLSRVCLAVIVGAVTHDVWDAFTHVHGAAVQALPALQAPVPVSADTTVPLFKVLQHASTFLGLLMLSVALMRWGRRTPRADIPAGLPERLRRRRLAGLVTAALVPGVAFALAQAVGAGNPAAVFAGRVVVATTSAAFVAATLYACVAGRQDAAG